MRAYLAAVCRCSLLVIVGVVIGYVICDDLWREAARKAVLEERDTAVRAGAGQYLFDSRTGSARFVYFSPAKPFLTQSPAKLLVRAQTRLPDPD